MIKGTVIFKLTNVGTKSQSEQPFLRVQEGVEFRIMVKGDNPFMHDLLRPYENKEVDIDGKFNERKVFIITNITELVIEPAEEPDVLTVNGWAMSILDRIPEEGDSFEELGLTVRVLKMDGRRIEDLHILDNRHPEDEEESDGEEE